MSGPILVGQSYFLRFDPKQWQGRRAYPPLGSLQAAACLRDAGFETRFFDAMLAESEEAWRREVDSLRPHLAVLFEDNFNYLSKMCLLRMREAAFTMIRAAKDVGATVLICGSDASDRTESYLEAGADFVLFGEGDATLVELASALENGGDPALIQGLAYRDDGELRRTSPRPVLRDLDALPRPAWDLVDMDAYRDIWLDHHGYFSMNVATTRGCPYHCNWCAKPIWGQTYHMRSPRAVAEELAHLAETYGPNRLWFADDILGLKKGWLAELADELEQHDIKIPFDCQSRVDVLLRPGEIDALARTGCRMVWVGAESGSQKILDAMDKGTRVEQIHEASQKLHAAGVRVGFFLQFGYPGEEKEDIDRTFDMVRDCRPDEIGMSVSYALPGTRFHERVQEELGAKQNWLHSHDLDMMHRGTYTTDFYRQLYRVLHKEFRMRRTGHRLRRRGFGALRPSRLREIAAAGFHFATLPLARRRLERLAVPNPERLGPLPSRMGHRAAAQPSAQEPPDAATSSPGS